MMKPFILASLAICIVGAALAHSSWSRAQPNERAATSLTTSKSVCPEKQYVAPDFGFQFCHPAAWKVKSEEYDVGRNRFRVRFNANGFIDESIASDYDVLLSVSVTEQNFEHATGYLGLVMDKEYEEALEIGGRRAMISIGKHEFGGYLVVATIENGAESIRLVLSTKQEPYLTDFRQLLDTFAPIH